MVESTRQVQSRDPFERFDEAIDDPRLYETTYQTYEFQRAGAREPDPLAHDPLANDPVPLFLADQHDERYQELPGYQELPEYAFAGGKKRKARTSRIVTGLLALSAIAAALALLSIDSTRAVIVNAKASLASAAPAPSVAAQPAPPRMVAQPVNAEPSATPDAATTRRIQPVALASASPSRDEIAAAYQSAIKTRVVAVEPATREAAPAARRIDPDELAALLKRAKGLLAIGDITSARLLLERAADAQEADAALMLAGTYDPQVLGTQDMRSITPDPAAARLWYQKAAQLGSSDAKRRLSQIQN
jgi:TPR repeat protein